MTQAVTLMHYSAKPLGTILRQAQHDTPDFKPRGLWVSVVGEDDWPTWCQAESFALNTFAHATRVDIDWAKVLHLKTVAEIDAFHGQYFAELYPGARSKVIDWQSVAKKYSGIIIAPYQWERRLKGDASTWYYSWDCASGCIWDPSCIVSLAEDTPPKLAALSRGVHFPVELPGPSERDVRSSDCGALISAAVTRSKSDNRAGPTPRASS